MENQLAPASIEEEAPEAVPEKPRAERSRLKTSWDAVANFFGVTTKEAEETTEQSFAEIPTTSAATPTKAGAGSKSDGGTTKSTGRKGKPSMWESVTEESEELAPKPASTESPNRESLQRDVPDRREIRNRQTPRRDAPTRDAPTRDRTARGESGPETDKDSSREPERRSHRRPPRRGRDSQDSEVATDTDHQQPRRPVREDSRSDRSTASRSASRRSAETRTPESSEKPESRAPSPSTVSRHDKKPTGFGAGIVGDDDRVGQPIAPLDNAFEDREVHPRSRDARDDNDAFPREVGSAGEEQEDRPRRRRRRGGRGRKQRDEVDSIDAGNDADNRTARASRDEDADDQSPDDGPSIRQVKIPSWNDAISVFVEANMLNHQRSQSSPRGNPRGRGRR
jgi:ribonuclease E